MRKFISNHLKNIGGWTTKRKILCFAVDDYGNILLNSKSAYEKLKSKGGKSKSHFSRLDALDTTQDFEMLFEVLSSHKDKNNRNSVFTTYALPANIDFEKVLEKNQGYEYELLPETYSKLSSNDKDYRGAYEMLMQGINEGFLKPQFHGREHLNVDLFNYHLKNRTPFFIENLNHNSYVDIPKNPDKPTVRYTRSFAFWNESETFTHLEIIKDGLNCFEKVYGYKPTTFTPPALQIHPKFLTQLEVLGIKSIDKPRDLEHHLGNGKYKRIKNKTEVSKGNNHVTIVRNCAFEPASSKKIDWINTTLAQVSAAFKLNKPAIISSHRVNFCGKIEAKNRKENLLLLDKLIAKIIDRHPDVEFLTVDELVEEIIKTNQS